MTKVALNQEGLDLKRQMLNELSPEDFIAQMELVQHSTRLWAIDNFILNEEQIEYLNTIPQILIDQMGINVRIAFQFNAPLILEVPEVYTPPLSANSPRRTTVEVEGGGTYTSATGELTWDITVGVKFRFP
jgi:CRP-like cAMP-binding protein